MNYWLISDTHFNHRKLDDLGRDKNWEQQLYNNLNKIPLHDTLIHLGDICMGDDIKVHEWLFGISNGDMNVIHKNGFLAHRKTVLVRGNHDKKSMNWYIEHGWDFVCDGLHLEYMGQTLLLTHRPMHPDMWRFTKNIHGHTHGNIHRAEEYESYYTKNYHIDISPEIVGYAPIRLDTLLKKK